MQASHPLSRRMNFVQQCLSTSDLFASHAYMKGILNYFGASGAYRLSPLGYVLNFCLTVLMTRKKQGVVSACKDQSAAPACIHDYLHRLCLLVWQQILQDTNSVNHRTVIDVDLHFASLREQTRLAVSNY